MPKFFQMWKSLQMTVRACLVLVAKVWSFLTYIFKKQVRAVSRRLNYFHLLILTLFRYNNTKPSNMTSPPCPPSPSHGQGHLLKRFDYIRRGDDFFVGLRCHSQLQHQAGGEDFLNFHKIYICFAIASTIMFMIV